MGWGWGYLTAAVVVLAAAGCDKSTDSGAPATGAETTTGDEGAEYEIRIHRPLRAGEVIGVSVESHHVMGVTVTDEEANVEGLGTNLHVQLEGTVTVLEASEDGAIMRATLAISRCVDPETGAVLFAPGSVVQISRDGGVVDVSLEGGQISGAQIQALVLAFPFRRPGSTFGEALLGTDRTKAVGDTWDLDRNYFTEDLYDEGIETTETNISGRTALTDVVDCAGGRCLVIESSLQATQASLLEMADEAGFESGEVQATVLVHAPVDTSSFLRREETMVVGNFVADFDTESGTIERAISLRRTRVARYAPVTTAEQ